MTERREFTAKTKLAAWERSGGNCENCGVKIYAGMGPEYDHAIRCELGGTNDLDNCRVLCRNCHGAKTYGRDIPEAAKGKRLRKSRAGIDKPRSRPMPGTKASGLRKRMNGTVERRERD
jgi:5-methylcytosine-specific restriction protein A